MKMSNSQKSGSAGSDLLNPIGQSITMLHSDGSVHTISLHEIDQHRLQAIQTSVIFAVQIGAGVIVLLMMIFLSRAEKTRTIIFWINLFVLLVLIIRNGLQIDYFTGPFYETYSALMFDASFVPRPAFYRSAVTSCLSLILVTCVQISLILQVRVVCASHPTFNLYITLVSVLISLISTGFYYAFGIYNIRLLFQMTVYDLGWLYPATNALHAFSICFYCAVFVLKLGFAIRQRRTLGLVAFGPLQVIFIMGCQTMILPAIFLIVENLVGFNGLASYADFLVAVSLPLSSLWAATKSNSETPSGISCRGFSSTKSSSASTTSTTTSHGTDKKSLLSKVGTYVLGSVEKLFRSTKSEV